MNGGTKLMYPGLAGFYATWGPIAATLVRVVVGIMFLMHVWGKFHAGADAVAANIMAKNGLQPAILFAYAAIFRVGRRRLYCYRPLYARLRRRARDRNDDCLVFCALSERLCRRRRRL